MRKNQLFLIVCFVSVSLFAVSGLFDSNAWAETDSDQIKKCEDKKTYDKWCILYQDLNLKTYLGYTNTTSNVESNGNSSLGAEISDTGIYGVSFGFSDKKILSQIFKYKKKDTEKDKWKRSTWDFAIDPWEINATVEFSRKLKVVNQTFTRDLTDKTSFEVKLVYKLPIENFYWNFFKK